MPSETIGRGVKNLSRPGRQGRFLARIRIAIDFDGTVVRHRFPEIGEEVPESARVIRRLSDAGHLLLLWSCRSGRFHDDAMAWLRSRDLRLQVCEWCPPVVAYRPPKMVADIYLDDRSLGVPLTTEDDPVVDWLAVERLLEQRGILDAQ